MTDNLVERPSLRSASGLANSRLSRFAEKMSDSKVRIRIYTCCAVGLYLMAMLLMFVKVRHGVSDRKFDFAPSDGKFYYVYITAATTEGSLNPKVVRHWNYKRDPKSQFDKNGQILNVYPIGVSLSVAPSFFVAHVLSKIVYGVTKSDWFTPDGYSALYQILNLAWVIFASWATFVLLDRIMIRYFRLSGAATILGVLGAWIGTQYTYHLLRFPLMSHVFGPFWATAFVYCAVVAADKIKRFSEVDWHWAGMSLCIAMAFECRNTNLIWSLFALYPLYLVVRQVYCPNF